MSRTKSDNLASNLTPVSRPQHLSEKHGFFTRLGGVSSGIYDSLNLGKGPDDQASLVADNRDIVRNHLGAKHLLTPHQIHSAICHIIDGPITDDFNIEADALVTNQQDIAIGVLSADCAPVLLADPTARIIGAAHAGWRGAASGIIGATIDAMCQLGAQRDAIQAVIGPCISQTAYEVGENFKQNLLQLHAQDGDLFAIMKSSIVESNILESHILEGHSKPHFDLPRFVKRQAERSGVQAHWSGDCTFSDPLRFFSYRRSYHAGEPDYGRQGSFICL